MVKVNQLNPVLVLQHAPFFIYSIAVIDVPNGVNGILEHDEINRLTQYLKQHKNKS